MLKEKAAGLVMIVLYHSGYLRLTIVYYLGVIMPIVTSNALSPYPPMNLLIAVKILSIPWVVFTLGYWNHK